MQLDVVASSKGGSEKAAKYLRKDTKSLAEKFSRKNAKPCGAIPIANNQTEGPTK